VNRSRVQNFGDVSKRIIVPAGCVHATSAMNAETSKSAMGRRGREHGAEMLEFALVFAALMMAMMGIVAFSRAYNIYETITRAAREGARMAVLPSSVYDQNNGAQAYIDVSSACTSPATTTNTPNTTIFNSYIAPKLQASSLAPGAVQNYQECTGWLSPTGTAVNQCGVTISFQYPYRLSIPFLGAGLTTLNIKTNVQMRREDQPVGANPTCP
jgi:Flp pilus assembly protein TadG